LGCWVGVEIHEIQEKITDLQSLRIRTSIAAIVLRMAEVKAKDATYARYQDDFPKI
jgi:hypothetical protein